MGAAIATPFVHARPPNRKAHAPLYSPALWEQRRDIVVPRLSTALVRPEAWAATLDIRNDEQFRRFTEALAIGDPVARRWLQGDPLCAMLFVVNPYGFGFTAFTDTYNSGSGTAVTPSGATSSAVISDGGGGGGGCGTAGNQAGGGGSARCSSTRAVAGGDSLGYSVGADGVGKDSTSTGSGTAGGASTTSGGTGGFAGLAHSAGGGGGGTSTTGGAAGTASGGTTNSNGNAGTTGNNGKGGNAASGAVGGANYHSVNLTDAEIGAAPGAGGGGGRLSVGDGKNGGAGRQSFAWT